MIEKYKFIFEDPNPNDVIILGKVLENDVYSKYKIEAKVCGEMIKSIDCDYYSRNKDNLAKETFKDYLGIIDTILPKNWIWAYNIIDGISEQDDIIYQNEHFVLIPTFTWDKKDMKKIHILSFVKDKQLKSIRSLTNNHISLLEHILSKSLDVIESHYGIKKEKFRAYIHYPPSAWLLHIHFNLVENKDASMAIDYTHELHQVVFNLKLCSEYYQKIDMYTIK